MIVRLLAAALITLTMQSAEHPTQKVPIAVPELEAAQHLTSDRPVLRVSADQADQMHFATIRVRVIVDANGSVISTKSSRQQDADIHPSPETLSEAESLVRGLQYTPFERNGHPVSATFEEYVSLLPPEKLPSRHLPFPKVKDLKSVKITLERTGCFGTCPSYSVVVHGDGTVEYDGEAYVAFTGQHRGSIPKQSVSELLDLFKASDYFSLDDEYHMSVTDNPTFITSIEIDGNRKQVTDYVGEEVGMPMAVSNLENEIDRLSGSQRWVRGNADTLAALKAEHWDFKSAEAAAALVSIAETGSANVVRDLVSAGVPLTANANSGNALLAAASRGNLAMLNTLLYAGAGADPSSLDMALPEAARSGNVEAFRLLIRNGAHIDARTDDGETVLMCAAMSGSPAMVSEVLTYKPDINAALKNPRATGLMTGEGLTALIEALSQDQFDVAPEGVNRAEVVRLLLDAGANPNARDSQGNTALILSKLGPDVSLMLIKAGADVNARNNDGQTALSAAYDDDVKRVLIEHGAVEKDH